MGVLQLCALPCSLRTHMFEITIECTPHVGCCVVQAIYQIRDWQPNKQDMVPEFICTVDVSGEIGDIAMLHQGDIVVSTSNVQHGGQQLLNRA